MCWKLLSRCLAWSLALVINRPLFLSTRGLSHLLLILLLLLNWWLFKLQRLLAPLFLFIEQTSNRMSFFILSNIWLWISWCRSWSFLLRCLLVSILPRLGHLDWFHLIRELLFLSSAELSLKLVLRVWFKDWTRGFVIFSPWLCYSLVSVLSHSYFLFLAHLSSGLSFMIWMWNVFFVIWFKRLYNSFLLRFILLNFFRSCGSFSRWLRYLLPHRLLLLLRIERLRVFLIRLAFIQTLFCGILSSFWLFRSLLFLLLPLFIPLSSFVDSFSNTFLLRRLLSS